MATFPALTPSAAPITPGAWPVTTTSSLNGAEARIRHGSAEIGRRLQLTFPNVTEADFLAIVAHYRGQRSGFDSFGFDTTTLAADRTPVGYAWLYASPPQVVDEHMDVFTVQCEFKAEPRGLVVAPGKAWRSVTTLTPGVATGGRAFTPAQLTTALWLDFGDASTVTLSGSSISQINDKSGNARNATQAISGKRLGYATASINGLNCATSNGDQFAALAASINVQSVLIVTQFTSPTSSEYQFILGDASTYPFHGVGYVSTLLDSTNADTAVKTGGGWVNGSSVTPLSMTKQSAVSIYAFNPAGTVAISQFSADRGNAYRGIIGNICEIVAFSSNINAVTRQRVEGYLAHRWGTTSSLPSGHPYKSAAPTF